MGIRMVANTNDNSSIYYTIQTKEMVMIMEKWKSNTVDLRGISYLSNYDDGGECKNGHFNIIPACTVIAENTKLHCDECGTLIFRVAKVKTIECEV
jgi:hypothetical protein